MRIYSIRFRDRAYRVLLVELPKRLVSGETYNMTTSSPTVEVQEKQELHADWRKNLSKFEKPSLSKVLVQLTSTLIPYFLLWGLMIYLVKHNVSYWYILPLLALAAGLNVRIFIFFHDCCHGSYFSSKNANRILGYITGIMRHNHAGHHATTGDLERRGVGDVWTLTVDEYLASSTWNKFVYRVFRNPLVLFGVAPLFVFLIAQRFPHKGYKPRELQSVIVTNLGVLAVGTVMSLAFGLKTYLLIQIPMMALASSIGIWLFYVQHQFELVYWEHHKDWDPYKAALEGSSYYKLPKILQWFTGNIGLHHLHHLRPKIANYNLQACYDSIPQLREAEPLTIRTSMKSLFLNLWDESNQKLVGFRALKTYRRQPSQ